MPLGFDCILIEKEEEYIRDIRKRVAALREAHRDVPLDGLIEIVAQDS